MLKSLLLDMSHSLRSSAHSPKDVLQFRKIHLGCGTNILPGWINIDLTGPAEVVKWDLTRPLNMPDESVDFIFNEHFIEHITRNEALSLLADCKRMLKRGGILRISTPNLRKLISEYVSGRTNEWSDVNWTPSTPCQLMNEGMRSWGHQFVYDIEEFEALLTIAGFAKIVHVPWRQSQHPPLRNLECRPFHHEIIVEATK
jgi:predicted SAM-dependent methyltransferase